MSVVNGSLAAVVVNWRTAGLTLRSVQALVDQDLAPERLVVVDNGSGDADTAQLRAMLPSEAMLIELSQNVGFARANNIAAARMPAANACLFVNSDAFAHSAGARCRRCLPRLTTPPSAWPYRAF